MKFPLADDNTWRSPVIKGGAAVGPAPFVGARAVQVQESEKGRHTAMLAKRRKTFTGIRGSKILGHSVSPRGIAPHIHKLLLKSRNRLVRREIELASSLRDKNLHLQALRHYNYAVRLRCSPSRPKSPRTPGRRPGRKVAFRRTKPAKAEACFFVRDRSKRSTSGSKDTGLRNSAGFLTDGGNGKTRKISGHRDNFATQLDQTASLNTVRGVEINFFLPFIPHDWTKRLKDLRKIREFLRQ